MNKQKMIKNNDKMVISGVKEKTKWGDGKDG